MTYQFLKHPEDPTSRKVIGSDGWRASRDDSHDTAGTGLWYDDQCVALLIGHSGQHEALDECEIVHETGVELVKRLNGYDVLLEYFNAVQGLDAAMGDGPEGETLEQAVERENKADSRHADAQRAVLALLKKA